MSAEHALVIVALRTDDEHIKRRLDTILACAASYENPPDTSPCVFAMPVGELVASDLDRLAEFIGWDGVRGLNLGADVVSEGGTTP
jgi:hypothetical protein